ncbi:hypothetical protein ABT097_28005 [Streptomyces sp. NPDC002225]
MIGLSLLLVVVPGSSASQVLPLLALLLAASRGSSLVYRHTRSR